MVHGTLRESNLRFKINPSMSSTPTSPQALSPAHPAPGVTQPLHFRRQGSGQLGVPSRSCPPRGFPQETFKNPEVGQGCPSSEPKPLPLPWGFLPLRVVQLCSLRENRKSAVAPGWINPSNCFVVVTPRAQERGRDSKHRDSSFLQLPPVCSAFLFPPFCSEGRCFPLGEKQAINGVSVPEVPLSFASPIRYLNPRGRLPHELNGLL